jgi:hypothetical protein
VFYKTPNIHWDDAEAIDALISKAMKGRTAWTPEDGDYDEFFKE